MLENVSAFLVYHASVAQRVLPEHFNIKEGMVFENLIQVAEEESEIKNATSSWKCLVVRASGALMQIYHKVNNSISTKYLYIQ